MDRQINHWIDGKIKISNSGRYGDVFDPSTGIVQAQVALASANEVDEAVKNSNEAFYTWA